MTYRTYKIELRMDFDDDKLHDLLTDVARDAARHMLATAMLLKDNKREPSIALEAGDMFLRDKELSILEDGEIAPEEESGGE